MLVTSFLTNPRFLYDPGFLSLPNLFSLPPLPPSLLFAQIYELIIVCGKLEIQTSLYVCLHLSAFYLVAYTKVTLEDAHSFVCSFVNHRGPVYPHV